MGCAFATLQGWKKRRNEQDSLLSALEWPPFDRLLIWARGKRLKLEGSEFRGGWFLARSCSWGLNVEGPGPQNLGLGYSDLAPGAKFAPRHSAPCTTWGLAKSVGHPSLWLATPWAQVNGAQGPIQLNGSGSEFPPPKKRRATQGTQLAGSSFCARSRTQECHASVFPWVSL